MSKEKEEVRFILTEEQADSLGNKISEFGEIEVEFELVLNIEGGHAAGYTTDNETYRYFYTAEPPTVSLLGYELTNVKIYSYEENLLNYINVFNFLSEENKNKIKETLKDYLEKNYKNYWIK